MEMLVSTKQGLTTGTCSEFVGDFYVLRTWLVHTVVVITKIVILSLQGEHRRVQPLTYSLPFCHLVSMDTRSCSLNASGYSLICRRHSVKLLNVTENESCRRHTTTYLWVGGATWWWHYECSFVTTGEYTNRFSLELCRYQLQTRVILTCITCWTKCLPKQMYNYYNYSFDTMLSEYLQALNFLIYNNLQNNSS